ncbi:MAG: YdcF family protein [Burkholderiales bacterium]|nr:YdcF family protein [Burkholderiales bacterium]
MGSSLCLLGLALFLAWRRRSRLSMACGALAMVWLWAWSTPVLSLWLRGTLEDQIAQPPLSRVPQTQAMVVLGGGVSPPSGKATDINLGAAADRVWYAARLFHAGKAPLLLLSGGSDPQRHAFSEARAMAIFLQDLGVPEQALVLEEASRNTLENAAFTAKLLNERGIRHVLLVTSALHMPRALALFSAQGLQVEPAPTDFEADNPPPGALAWLPDAEALDGSGRAMKEWVGKWVGR